MSREQVERGRQQKDIFFRASPQSPLTMDQKVAFTGLKYFDFDPDLDLTISVTLLEQHEPVQVFTTDNQIRNYTRFAEFTFAVDGKQARLTIYKTEHGYFLPFVDANAGKETYPVGRYLDPELVHDNLFHIDFNQAYNPFCAYNDTWSCPITPHENRIDVAIRAGEKKFPK